jgi:heme-degrading monooxygenase HmoA
MSESEITINLIKQPTQPTQLVTMMLYTFKTNKYWAFTQMQLGISQIQGSKGLQFVKMLGTGAGNGFSIWPNFSQYAMLCVWENEQSAIDFFTNNAFQKTYLGKSESSKTYWLKPVFGHGVWDGQQPFEYGKSEVRSGKIAVITRATIRPSRMIEFWRYVPSVSKNMQGQKGLNLAVGVGEWPLIQQATFSVWDSWELMKDFAYNQDMHKKVIQKTRTRNWYSEELFARFDVIKEENGRSNP